VSQIFLRACFGAIVACAALTGACSVIVAPEDTVILCQYDPALPPDPCPTGFDCVEGRCLETITPPRPDGCVPSPEECNGRDDNCNGVVDEGFDADGDGFTFCGSRPGDVPGTFVASAPNAGFADCDDSNPDVHPGAPDLCDGRVNRCPATGRPDDEATCDNPLFQCVAGQCVDPNDCTIFPDRCTGGQVCDSATLACVTTTCDPAVCEADGLRCGTGPDCVPLSALGANCNVDSECETNFCIAREALGLPTGTAKGVCGRACCNGECNAAASEECVQAASGARTCLPTGRARELGIPVPASRTCQSFFDRGYGACLAESTDGCRDASGSPEEVCRFWQIASCGFPGDPNTIYGCGLPCDSAAVCAAGEHCEFIAAGNTWLGRCAPVGGAAVGASCGSNNACEDGICVAGFCGKACCTDANCDGSNFCRPYQAGGGLVSMRCQTVAATPL
jgi:hypothetical protein